MNGVVGQFLRDNWPALLIVYFAIGLIMPGMANVTTQLKRIADLLEAASKRNRNS